jgi:hypothetical protein
LRLPGKGEYTRIEVINEMRTSGERNVLELVTNKEYRIVLAPTKHSKELSCKPKSKG